MKLTRYYARKPFEAAHIRATRELLSSTFTWDFSYASYALYYRDSFYTVETIKDADKIITENGHPAFIYVALTSRGGRTVHIETRIGNHISISVDNKGDPPEAILDSLETVLGITRLTESTHIQNLSSAFIAHVFDDTGHNAANELARFLSLIGIRCHSGRAFSPNRVSVKVNDRLAAHDLFFGIVTPHNDHTWITQEIATAAALHKPLFILKHNQADLKTGILGDHEYISIGDGSVAKAFIPILEGINQISNRPVAMYPWLDDEWKTPP